MLLSPHYLFQRWKHQFFWLMAVLILASGIGLRDPWPPDEPRFALVAQEMVNNGEWLIPTRGGEAYPDKPPVFMWVIAGFLLLTGSMKLAFLMPSLLAGLGTLYLLGDLLRRWYGRDTALIGMLLLLFMPQFVAQSKLAQIDALLMFWITLGMYALFRYLFDSKHVGWLVVCGAAAGLGVITKGVGFLVLLAIPWVFLVQNKSDLVINKLSFINVLIIVGGMLGIILLWLLPMLWRVEQSSDPVMLAYRDNILFKQTGERYANAWHHIKPWWFFIGNVIPVFWLPLMVFIPGLIKPLKNAWVNKDPRVVIPLLWVLSVIVFFSVSPGKRGQYILPALPIMVLAVAAFVRAIYQHKWCQTSISGLVALIALALSTYTVFVIWIKPELGDQFIHKAGFNPFPLLLSIGLFGLILSLMKVLKKPVWSKPWSLALAFWGFLWISFAWVGYPEANFARSWEDLQQKVMPRLNGSELAMLGWREQMLLRWDTPVTQFGYLVSIQEQERKAIIWLQANQQRKVLFHSEKMPGCFDLSRSQSLGDLHRRQWWLADFNAVKAECYPESP
ncbi:MAG: ArnT family glycosyltransferase [bacterium]